MPDADRAAHTLTADNADFSTDAELLALLTSVAARVRAAVRRVDDWRDPGTRPGQYRIDLAADEVVVRALIDEGFGVLSEESGLTGADAELLVIADPIDGSTNASLGIPWFATSLCVVDRLGARAALVVNQADGTHFTAVRGRGARRDGVQLRRAHRGPRDVSAAGEDHADDPGAHGVALGDAVVAVSGMAPRPLGTRQFRALGACALDLCAVAAGVLDGYVDCSRDAHGVWDYAGGMFVCLEAGVVVADAFGRDLLVREHAARRTPLAAADRPLLAALTAVRAQW